ncbi:MAG: hypothetical protein AB7N76_04185 [Planctomycetota bacterium]
MDPPPGSPQRGSPQPGSRRDAVPPLEASDPDATRLAQVPLEDLETLVVADASSEASEERTAAARPAAHPSAEDGTPEQEITRWDSNGAPLRPRLDTTRWVGPALESLLEPEDPGATYVGSEELPTPPRNPPVRPPKPPAANTAEASLDRALLVLGLAALALALLWLLRRSLWG